MVRALVGHGIGKEMHEDPAVPNFGKAGTGVRLKAGTVLCIEPMINMGGYQVDFLSDGWTVETRDKQPSAHYENTVVIRGTAWRFSRYSRTNGRTHMKVKDPVIGGAAESLSGRDKGRLYIIVAAEGERLSLADGKYRKLSNPKHKNSKHVRLMPFFFPEIVKRAAKARMRTARSESRSND